ncbi:MAG: hypothetical protein QOC86_2627 [Gaiellales bacterium]|nr:hypothetical protein [Gaiellales bacterium]
MLVIIGLIVLVAAVVVGVAGVLGNAGVAHSLGHGFAIFGYHVTGSTGTLFLSGIVVGAVAVTGLALLLAAARRTARRGRNARTGLEQSRRETAAVSKDRDDLLDERNAAHVHQTAARRPSRFAHRGPRGRAFRPAGLGHPFWRRSGGDHASSGSAGP